MVHQTNHKNYFNSLWCLAYSQRSRTEQEREGEEDIWREIERVCMRHLSSVEIQSEHEYCVQFWKKAELNFKLRWSWYSYGDHQIFISIEWKPSPGKNTHLISYQLTLVKILHSNGIKSFQHVFILINTKLSFSLHSTRIGSTEHELCVHVSNCCLPNPLISIMMMDEARGELHWENWQLPRIIRCELTTYQPFMQSLLFNK